MYKLVGSLSMIAIANGIGNVLDPTNSVAINNVIFIIFGTASIGWVLGAIADGVNE